MFFVYVWLMSWNRRGFLYWFSVSPGTWTQHRLTWVEIFSAYIIQSFVLLIFGCLFYCSDSRYHILGAHLSECVIFNSWHIIVGCGRLSWWSILLVNREVPGLIPSWATSHGVSVVDAQLRIPSDLYNHPVHLAEYPSNRVWRLNEELPIAAKSRAKRVWYTLP